jgi:hypothetical protein
MIKFWAKNIIKILLLGVLVINMSCTKEANDDTPQSVNPEELQRYLDRFLAETAERGQTFDVSTLDLRFVPAPDQNQYCAVGHFNYNNSGRQRIEIVNTSDCWNDRSEIEKENLFYHEMGHALLNRPHLETKLPNGLPLSIMCSDCNNFAVVNKFQTYKWDYYFQELLFQENATEPDWGRSRTFFQEFYSEKLSEDTNWNFGTGDPSITSSINTGDTNYPEGGLTIGSKDEFTNGFGSWVLNIQQPSIEEGASVQVKVKFSSLQEIEGDGLSVALRADNIEDGTVEVIHFINTQQGSTQIKGEFQRTVSLILPGYASASDRLLIFVIFLGNTRGEVIIEDVEITVATE